MLDLIKDALDNMMNGLLKKILPFILLWGFHVVVFVLLYDTLGYIQGLKTVGISWGMLVYTHEIIFAVLSFILSIFEIFKNGKTKLLLIAFCAVYTLLLLNFTIEIGDVTRRYCTLYFSEMTGLLLPYFIYKKIFQKD